MPKFTKSKANAKNEFSSQKTRIYPGFVYKLRAKFPTNAIALTDSLFAIPGEPPPNLEEGVAYELSGNGISKETTLHYIDTVSGESILKQYPCSRNRINESMAYELFSAT